MWVTQSLIQASPWALGRNVINILVSVNILTSLHGYVVEHGQTREKNFDFILKNNSLQMCISVLSHIGP